MTEERKVNTMPQSSQSKNVASMGYGNINKKDVNILLVDDKPARLLSYEAALESLGYNLVCANSGRQALKALMEMEFATILLDVSMPELDGFETAALIHQHPRFEETPIIFVTGVHVTDMDSLKGYAIGAVDYIYIPVVPEILRGKVQALVQLYLQRVELSRLNRELAQANAKLATAHEELKISKMRELQELNTALEVTNDELLAINAKLTQEVKERKKAEQELSQLSQRKDEYIAILAHELRNPLSAIHNAVNVMEMAQTTKQQRNWAQALLQRQVNHLTCLMDDLLDVSRISNGRIELRLESIDLVTIVTQAAETVTPLLKKCGHTLTMKLPEEQYCVQGDFVRLTQVLDNLLSNAAKYMEHGGEIQLTLKEADDGYAVISIRDHGLGISKQMLESVFDLFVQAPTAINRAHGGLGIGLALVRALVEMHKGKVTVASEGENKGAEFSVYLPLSGAKSIPQPLATPAQQPDSESVTLRILVIDDNVESAQALKICLEALRYTVRVCHNGETGAHAAIEFNPDVILLDIGLPDIDGYKVAARLRDDSRFDRVAIIAMTGFGGKADIQRAEAVGFNNYLVKPLDFDKLHGLLGELVAANAASQKRSEAT